MSGVGDDVLPPIDQLIPEQRDPEENLEEPTKFYVKLAFNVTAEQIVRGLGDGAPLDVHELIIELDQEVGLWALTILLARYFEGQMKLAQEHCPELIGKTTEELVKELEE